MWFARFSRKMGVLYFLYFDCFPARLKTPRMARRYCSNCLFPEKTCICALVAQFQTISYSGAIHVLQHPDEIQHSKNTLRLVKQLLPSIQIWCGEAATDFSALTQLTEKQPHQWGCFFPTANSHPQSVAQPDLPSCNLIYIDATWRKARKIWHLNPWLWDIPCYRLTEAPVGQYRIRKNHAPGQLSTLEAIAYSLENVINTQDLLTLFEQFQQRTESFSATGPDNPSLQE